jgi:hypothetical protein
MVVPNPSASLCNIVGFRNLCEQNLICETAARCVKLRRNAAVYGDSAAIHSTRNSTHYDALCLPQRIVRSKKAMRVGEFVASGSFPGSVWWWLTNLFRLSERSGNFCLTATNSHGPSCDSLGQILYSLERRE